MLFNLFFPKFCLFCSQKGSYICRDCFLNYANFSYVQVCHVCGVEVRSGLVHKECKELSYVDGVFYVCRYDSFSKTVIYKVKYSQYSDIISDISKVLSEYYYRFNVSPDIVTSVPMHITKQNKRGFNQAQMIAQQFCTSANLRYHELLVRSRPTKTQVGMDKDQRLINLKNAFSIKEVEKSKIENRKILIIDDVYTTGSTLNEIAKVLKEAGAKEVYGYTLAKR